MTPIATVDTLKEPLTVADIADRILHVIGAAFGLFWILVYLWILWLDLGAWLA